MTGHLADLLVLSLLLGLPVACLLLAAARLRRVRPRSARRLAGIAVSLTVLGIAALLGEAYLRFVYDQPQNIGPLCAWNWYLRHAHVGGIFRGPTADEVRTGRRPIERVPIVVLGDSVAWGQGVEVDQAFPTVLSRDLGLPVLAAARPGWSTRDELEWLRASGARPRLLVLSYSFNDIEDAGPSTRVSLREEEEAWARAPHRSIPLLGRSWLLDAAVYRLKELRGSGRYEAWVLEAYADREAVARHLLELRKVEDWAKDHGARLCVLLWPARGPEEGTAFRDLEDRFLSELRGGLESATLLPVGPLLDRAGIRTNRAYRAGPRDAHPGPAAHRVAARALEEPARLAIGARSGRQSRK